MKKIYLYIGLLISLSCYSQCPANWTLSGTVTTSDNRQASNSITATNVITGTGTARYHAGNYLQFKPGFRSVNGSRLRGYIEGCSGLFINFSVMPDDHEIIRPDDRISKTDRDASLFSLSPNPASEKVDITSDRVMQTVTVASMAGVVLYRRDIKSESGQINVSGYPPGFYVITVTLDDGTTEVQKLIKH